MFDDTRSIVEQRLQDNWTETLIDFDNVKFAPERGTPFIRLQIEWATANIISVGGRIRGEGFVLISVFVKAGSGSTQAQQYADDLALLFNKWNELALRFGAAMQQRVGQAEEWFQINVSVPFKYDECFAPVIGYGGSNGYGV